ncbi:MAG: HipA family kinase [Gemmataceae bacterium]
MTDTPLSQCAWRPTLFKKLAEPPFDTSMGTARVKTDATYGYLKAMGNREGLHALATELVASSLAHWFGLSVPDFAVLPMTETDCYPLPRGAKVIPGPAFVSREQRGRPMARNDDDLDGLVNKADVTRLVVFDTWVRNCDRYPPADDSRKPNYRNVHMATTSRPGQYRLLAIDHTHCFDRGRTLTPHIADIDKVRDDGVYGLFPEFLRFIDPGALAWCESTLRGLQADTVRAIVDEVPAEWEVGAAVRAALVDFLTRRAAYLVGKLEQGWGAGWRRPPAE